MGTRESSSICTYVLSRTPHPPAAQPAGDDLALSTQKCCARAKMRATWTTDPRVAHNNNNNTNFFFVLLLLEGGGISFLCVRNNSRRNWEDVGEVKRGKNENEKCECATARYGGTPFDFIVENKTKRKIDPFFFVVVFFYSFVTLVVC